jgi:REP element-mobilizing transposase RayT
MNNENYEVPGLKIWRRNLPHRELAGSTYFITFRLKTGRLSTEEVSLVLEHIKKGDPAYYDLFAATVMPDHVHMILRPKAGVSLSRIMKGLKGVTARLINARRGRRGGLWQDESYDRIIRDDEEMEEKIGYIFKNALKQALCNDGWDYEGFYLRDGL